MPSRRSALPHSPPSRLAGRVPFASSRPRHPRRAAGVMGSLWALLPLGQPGVGEASSRRTGPHQALIDASSTAVARQCVYSRDELPCASPASRRPARPARPQRPAGRNQPRPDRRRRPPAVRQRGLRRRVDAQDRRAGRVFARSPVHAVPEQAAAAARHLGRSVLRADDRAGSGRRRSRAGAAGRGAVPRLRRFLAAPPGRLPRHLPDRGPPAGHPGPLLRRQLRSAAARRLLHPRHRRGAGPRRAAPGRPRPPAQPAAVRRLQPETSFTESHTSAGTKTLACALAP